MFVYRELQTEDDTRWEELVRVSAQGNAFLRMATLRLLAAHEHPVAQVWRVGAFQEDGRLAGGWAVLVRRRVGIRYCSSFPLFYAGPLLTPEWNEPQRRTQRMDLLQGLAKALQQGLDILDTEVSPSLPDARGLVYAGCRVEQMYTHVWPACSEGELRNQLNRTKRQEAASATKRHVFGWKSGDAKTLDRLDWLHNHTLTKFKWVASRTWRSGFLSNIRELEAVGLCRLFVAAPEAMPETPCALVAVLLSADHHCAWLWRVAYRTDDSGLIPALYLHAGEAIKREFGAEWTINFGGSPNLSLARFKDYLGAMPTQHWRLRWQRAGLKALGWNSLQAIKEIFRKRLTLWHVIRSPRRGELQRDAQGQEGPVSNEN